MGGGEIIASFLDEGMIDEFIISVVPIFIGQGMPLIAQRHRAVPLYLRSSERFPDGVVQLHYEVARPPRRTRRAAPRKKSAEQGVEADEA